MQQLADLWITMDARRKAMLAGGIAGLIAIIVILSRLATAPGMALLYSGLDAAAAGEVVAALDARGTAYDVRGDSIFVDQAERDGLRMALAAEGLPANGAAGYELLDTLPGFGTTAQMFDAAYWRAKEGELARTILSSPMVRAARVHIAHASNDPFADRQDITASVTLRPAAAGVTDSFARAMRYMVASSVPGLLPANVTIIDADSGEVIGADATGASVTAAERQADALRENIERLLVARVGPGNAMVQVNVELISERETVLERRIDPASRVIVATESEASSSSARNSDAGAVTVASNLPEREASEGDQSSEQGSETRERTEYDHSILTREVESGPDRIRRITVAVLVNGQIETDATGAEVLVPRSDAELEALGALVQSAIGFDAERGDQVTIRSLAFEALPDAGTATAGTGGLFSSLDVAQLIRGGLLALVALAVIFGVVRPALASAGTARPAGSLPQPDDVAIRDDLNPPGDDTADDPLDLGGLPGLPALGDAPAWDGEIITSDAPDDAFDSGSDDPVDRLRRLIEEREAETVEILRSWMEEDEEATR